MSKIRNKAKYLAITILIGGKSTRFGSDKGLFQIFGKPLISYELETLIKLNFDIFLVAHSHEQVQKYLDRIDIRNIMAFVIDDYSLIDDKNIKSPMIGLYSAFKELNKLGYEKTLVLPCDIPLIQKSVLELLIEESKDYDCCISQWNNGLFEPLLAVYPISKGFKRSIDILKIKNLKLTNILSRDWRIKIISIENSIRPLDPQMLSFFNINEQSELEMIKIRLKSSF